MTVVAVNSFAPIHAESVQLLRHLRDLNADPGYPTEMVWHPRAPILAGRSRWGEWHWWHVDGRVLRRFTAQDFPATQWSADGHWCVMYRRQPMELRRSLRQRNGSLRHSGQIAVWCEDGRIGLKAKVQATHPWYNGVSWHPTMPILAFIRADSTVGIWDARTDRVHHIPHSTDVIGWLPDGQSLFTRYRSVLKLWDLSGRVEAVFGGYGHGFGSTLTWNADGSILVSAATGTLTDGVQSHSYTFWDRQGRLLHNLVAPAWHFYPQQALSWHPDGSCIALAVDRQIQIFGSDGCLIQTLEGHHGAAITALAWHPQGRLLASGAWDSTVHLWHPSGALVHILPTYRLLRSPIGVVAALAWHSQGHVLATSLRSMLVSLWGIPVNPAFPTPPPAWVQWPS